MRINKVEYLEEYQLKLVFNDEKVKIVDLEEIVKKGRGMFLPLKDLKYFKQVAVDDDNITICWPNGADLCPDVLYEIGKDIQEQPRRVGQRKKSGEKTQFKYQSTAIAKKVSRKAKI